MNDLLKSYLQKPFTRRVELVSEEDGTYFVAYIAELPWIRVYGDSRAEVLRDIGPALHDGLQVMIDAGDAIPEPNIWPQGLMSSKKKPKGRKLRKHWLRRGPRQKTGGESHSVTTWDPTESTPFAPARSEDLQIA